MYDRDNDSIDLLAQRHIAQQRIAQLQARVIQLEGLMQEFVDRLECGAGLRQNGATYGKFKAALQKIEVPLTAEGIKGIDAKLEEGKEKA